MLVFLAWYDPVCEFSSITIPRVFPQYFSLLMLNKKVLNIIEEALKIYITNRPKTQEIKTGLRNCMGNFCQKIMQQ